MDIFNSTSFLLACEMLFFGILGIGIETAFTAITDYKNDPKRHLFGYSSLWYIPLYALTPLFFHFTGTYLFGLPLLIRGAVYTLVIFTAEYLGMLALRWLLGSSPSEESYVQSRWNVHGLIRLDFAPAWFALGLALELIFRFLN